MHAPHLLFETFQLKNKIGNFKYIFNKTAGWTEGMSEWGAKRVSADKHVPRKNNNQLAKLALS